MKATYSEKEHTAVRRALSVLSYQTLQLNICSNLVKKLSWRPKVVITWCVWTFLWHLKITTIVLCFTRFLVKRNFKRPCLINLEKTGKEDRLPLPGGRRFQHFAYHGEGLNMDSCFTMAPGTFPILPASNTERKRLRELAKDLNLKTSPTNVGLKVVASAIDGIRALTTSLVWF